MKQKTEEWYAARAGKVTCSELVNVMTERSRGEGELEGRRRYKFDLAFERLCDQPLPSFRSAATDWGNTHEPAALARYEALTGSIVEEDGLIDSAQLLGFAGSPDGVIREDGIIVGGIEIKCPSSGYNHMLALASGEMPEEHYWQVHGLMAVTGAQWWDFVSFDPRMPDHLKLFVRRIWREEEVVSKIHEKVGGFLSEVNDLVDSMIEMDKATILYDISLDREAVFAKRAAALAEALRIAEEEAARKAAEKAAKEAEKAAAKAAAKQAKQ